MTKPVLDGVRIADFTWAWAGPYGTLLLAMLGAEVIKIESANRLDHTRVRSLAAGRMSPVAGVNASSIFADLNFNKESITLDLTKPEAIEVAKKIIAKSDAVVQNFRPGVIDKLGLGYEVLKKIKPDIIMLSSSAVGSTGPEKRYAGYAPTFSALSGLAGVTGYKDGPPHTLMGSIDLRSATTTAFALMAALNYRATSGEGQHVDLCSRESISVLMGEIFLDYTMNGRVEGRKGNDDGLSAPHNCYRCQGEDKWISIVVTDDQEWQKFCQAIGDPEWTSDAKFADGFSRWQNRVELDRRVEEWTKQHTPYQAMEILQNAGVAAVPSFSGEDLFTGPHLKEREFLEELEHPIAGKRKIFGPPWKLSATPAKVFRRAPLLGEHNEKILTGLLGLGKEDIERLQEAGALT